MDSEVITERKRRQVPYPTSSHAAEVTAMTIRPRRKYIVKPKLTESEFVEREQRRDRSTRYSGFRNWNKRKEKPEMNKSVCIANCVCKLRKMCSTRVGDECMWDLENRFWVKSNRL